MLAFIQANSVLVGYIISSVIALITFYVNYRLKVSEHEGKMKAMQTDIENLKADMGVDRLEILQRLDKLTDKISSISETVAGIKGYIDAQHTKGC